MPKRIVGAACAALFSFTVVAAEQAAPQSPTQGSTPGASQPQPAQPAPAAGQITVTGCVTREVAGQFALSNVSSSPAGATASRPQSSGAIAGSTGSTRDGATAGAVGTSGSAAATSSAAGAASANDTSYSLAGDRENDLEKYVGQRVEVVGTLNTESSSGSPAAGSSSSAAGSKSGDAASAPITKPEGSSTREADAARSDSDRGDANRPSASAPASSSASASGHAQRLNIVSVKPVGGQCE